MKIHLMLVNPKTIVTIFILAVSFTTPASAQFHFQDWFCSESVGNYSANSTYQNNLRVLLPYLANQASLNLFNNYTVGDGADQVYMLYNCRGDLTGGDCQGCVQAAMQTILEKCPVEKEAIVWYEECMIRYANRSIFSREEDDLFSVSYSKKNATLPNFEQVMGKELGDLIMQAAYNTTTRGYAIGEVDFDALNKVYCLAQCTPDILGSRCERCLRASLRTMAGCCGTTSAAMLFAVPSCQLRYDPAQFLHLGGINSTSAALPVSPPLAPSTPPPPVKSRSNSRMITSYGGIMFFLVLTTSALSFISL